MIYYSLNSLHCDLFMSLDAAIVFAGLFPPDVMLTQGDYSSILLIILISLSSFSPCRLIFARATHLLARPIGPI